jgi:hypothetical protein
MYPFTLSEYELVPPPNRQFYRQFYRLDTPLADRNV